MPRIEFHPTSTSRAIILDRWLENQRKSQDVEYVIDTNGTTLIVYRDRRLPTFIYETSNRAGAWDGHAVLGEQAALDEIQKFIGEKGVIFDSTVNAVQVPEEVLSVEHRGEQVFVQGSNQG